jgi:hypothetical protein
MSNQPSEKPIKKRLLSYSEDNFPMYAIWFKEFFKIHNQTYEFISKNLENYYKKFNEIFFEWLNYPKNRSKFMFEIKKEFMIIADKVLLDEIMDYQLKISQHIFVIGPFQKYLEFIADDDSPIDGDIDMFSDSDPDIEPDYSLLDNSYVEECIIDDDYYLSFFK